MRSGLHPEGWVCRVWEGTVSRIGEEIEQGDEPYEDVPVLPPVQVPEPRREPVPA